MKKYFGVFILFLTSLVMLSCSSDDDTPAEPERLGSSKTVFVFFPYTGNLYGYLSNNILDMERAILQSSDNPNVLVYINSSKKDACLYSIRREGSVCVHDTLRVYEGKDNTSADELASLFSEVKSLTPETEMYSMIIGCHGMGWIYGDDFAHLRNMYPVKYFDNEDNPNPITRWMGGNAAKIDVDTFAQAMSQASFHPGLMLFDVCYMANVETMYELRNSADYIVASPIEIMGKGMPYELIWNDILDPSPQAKAVICKKVYDYYRSSDQPYCSMSAIDCSKLEALADVVREINFKYQFDESKRDDLQMLDGYRPSIFYDLGRYVELLCGDAELHGRYSHAMSEAVFINWSTENYYTSLSQGAYGANPIYYCSGLTTSAPSDSKFVEAGRKNTQWYKATH